MAAPARAASLFPSSPFSNKAAGTTSAQFLKLPTGAREEALGGAAAAGSEGANSMFWNPAGLARIAPEDPSELAVGYSALLETTYAGSVAYARPVRDYGVFSGGLVYFSQSAQTGYSVLGDQTGSFTPNDLGFSFGYGRRVGDGVLVGGGLKIIRSAVSDASGATAAVDAGVQAPHVTEAGDGAVDVGAAISNLGPPLKVGSQASPLPFAGRMGLVWHTSPNVNSMLDVVLPVDQDPYVSLGLEAVLRQPSWSAALRGGFNSSRTHGVDGLTGVTAGAGLDFRRFELDYAWVPFGDLGTTNRITLAYRF